METVKKIAKRCDLFLFEVVPRHVNYDTGYTSWPGVAATIVMLTIVLSYTGFAVERFFTAPPSTSVRQTPTEFEKNTMSPTCISVPGINNMSYFGYTAKRVDIGSDGKKIKEVYLNWTKIGQDKACIAPGQTSENYLQSVCNNIGECSILKVHVFYCGTPSKKNPAANAKCAPANELVNTLEYHYIDVDFYNPVQGNMTVHTAPKANASTVVMTRFALNRTVSPPDMLRNFASKTILHLMYEDSSFSVQRYFSPSIWAPSGEILELQASMSGHIIETQLTITTSLDVAATCGAFASLVFTILGVVFVKLNRYFFYQENPMWAHVGERFTVDQADLNRAVDAGEVDSEYANFSSPALAADGTAAGGGASLLGKVKTPKRVQFAEEGMAEAEMEMM